MIFVIYDVTWSDSFDNIKTDIENIKEIKPD